MKNIVYLFIITAIVFSCSEGNDLESKKADLEKKRKELDETQAKIKELEKEIAVLDPKSTTSEKTSILVTAAPISKRNFAHFVEVRGSVESTRNITIASETAGAIEKIPVEEGQSVQRGQLLLRQDASILESNVAELKTSLDMAKTVFEKQSNLWKQNIGTEIQYLQAKNNKESLELKLKTLQAQIAKSAVKAPFSGIVDQIMVREGESALPGSPLVRVVSLDNIYIEADVSESYLGKIKKGDQVFVSVPTLNKEYRGTIRSISQVINPQNRTFTVEVAIDDKEQVLRPKMMAIVKIKDMEVPSAVVIPTNLIQQDKKNEYVFIAYKNGKGYVAQKVNIQRGETYQNETLVKEGLTGNELLIQEGFREVTNNVPVKIVQQ